MGRGSKVKNEPVKVAYALVVAFAHLLISVAIRHKKLSLKISCSAFGSPVPGQRRETRLSNESIEQSVHNIPAPSTSWTRTVPSKRMYRTWPCMAILQTTFHIDTTALFLGKSDLGCSCGRLEFPWNLYRTRSLKMLAQRSTCSGRQRALMLQDNEHFL
jgi:hypothetical protein